MLADTSVWIDHLRRGNSALRLALDHDDVQIHEHIIGELACGNLRNRDKVLGMLSALPALPTVPHDGVLAFISARRLMGSGLGWTDIHLLAAARVAGVPLYTLDKQLARIAASL